MARPATFFVRLCALVVLGMAGLSARAAGDDTFVVLSDIHFNPFAPKDQATSRIGEDTKVIFTGDTTQIDAPYVGSTNNALAVLIRSFAGQRCFGHVTLTACERSEVASLAAELL